MLKTNTAPMAMRTGSTRNDWWVGRFGVERKCDCRRGQRSAECHDAGWHLVDSSDDRADAVACALELGGRTGVTHRAVDQDDYSEVTS